MTWMEIALMALQAIRWIAKHIRRGSSQRISSWLSRKDGDDAVLIVQTERWIRDLLAWTKAFVAKLKEDPIDAIIEAIPADADEEAVFFGDVDDAIEWLAIRSGSDKFVAIHLEDL